MRFSRVHSVIAGTTLAAVLAGSSLWATAEAAPQPAGTTSQSVVQHRIPAADPSTALALLGKLGLVQDLIGQLTAMAGAKPAPSPADVQALAGKLTTAITDLKNSAPASPLLVSGQHARHGLVPVPNPLGDALTKLQGDVTNLVNALLAVDVKGVAAALAATVTDLLAVVTQTVASLGLSLPGLPLAHH